MGAIKFVTNGADVMGPGIVDADKGISENDPVWICDEKHHKPLAVGIATINGEQMINKIKGKAVKVIHYVGDNLWNFSIKNK
jgi:predicted RNA-binding protein (TIGR00451 family)